MKPTQTLATCQTPDGTVMVLQEHDANYYLKVGGVQLMSTNASSSEQQMAELACVDLPSKSRILIGGLGFGFTLRRVLELAPADAVVDVAELVPEMIEWNRTHLLQVNGHLLNDPRVKVHQRDVAELIQGCGKNRYQVILMDVDNSPDPLVQKNNARLYQKAGVARTREALQPGGRVIFWSANPDQRFVKTLELAFKRVECIGAKAYPKARRFTHTLFLADRD